MKSLLLAAITMALPLMPMQAPGVSGRISGIVIQAGTEQPIDGVQVILTSVASAVGATQQTPIGSLTDQFGRFLVRDLPPGRYRIQWTRPGYFTPPVGTAGPDPSTIQSFKRQLGIDSLFIASPPAATSVTVDLGPGERLEGFVFALVPGGVISGRALDTMGNPLVSATMTALTLSYEDGHRVLRPGSTTTSDDRGIFRLFGLRPGEYYVRAEPRRSPSAPGESVRAYFPGVAGVINAIPILVNESGESPGADFSIPNGGTVRVLGKVLGPTDVRRSNLQFCLLPAGNDQIEDEVSISMRNYATVAVNSMPGEFELRGIPPGEYRLCAYIYDDVQRRSYNGRVGLSVGTQDVQNVIIELHSDGDVKGRVLFDDATPSRMPLTLRLRDPQGAVGRALPPFINPEADGTFVISHVPEARYSMTQNASDICIVDLRQGGKSVYDDGFVGGSDAEPIEVVLSKQCGTVQVQIMDDRKQPVSNAFVSLVPAVEHRRNTLLYRRSIFDVAASKYPPIDRIPPGEYKMFAWDNVPPNAELNPVFLSKFEDLGVPIRIGRGESLTVQIPLISTRN